MEFSASTPPPYIEQPSVARSDTSFLRQVFGWMFGGLVITGGVAAVLSNTLSHEFLTNTGRPVFIGALILELVVVIFLVAAINRVSAAVATTAFLFYAALNGFTFAFIFAFYTTESVFDDLLRDRRGLRRDGGDRVDDQGRPDQARRDPDHGADRADPGLDREHLPGLSTIYWVTTYAGVLIFCGLTAYDIQKLKRLNTEQMTRRGATSRRSIGALALYLDFINLFLFLLRIFGASR